MSERVHITVTDHPDRNRFEAVDDSGVVAGVAEYRRQGDTVVFTHTEVDDAFEGRGVGSALVRGALDQVRDAGHPIVARCPFVAEYIERHPEYQELLAG